MNGYCQIEHVRGDGDVGTLCASLRCHGIHYSIRAYNPHPRWRTTLTSIIEVVVILAVIIAAVGFFVKRA
jgi:hypothetical protein